MRWALSQFRAALGIGGMVAWLLMCFVPFLPLALLKLLWPTAAGRRWLTWRLEGITEVFSWGCERIVHGLGIARWALHIDQPISRDMTYLLVCNHQSWVDILLLLIVFRGRMRFPRFFLKRSHLWTPVIGFVCWAFDFPFVHRYSREQLAQHPELRGRDAAIARDACAKFRHLPVTIVNYLEGTRFTAAKHAASGSPYRHLLPPRVGGLAEAFGAMGEQFDAVLDMTIRYHGIGSPGFWRFARGYPHPIGIDVQVLPVPAEVLRAADRETRRAAVRQWIDARWALKDERLAQPVAAPDQTTGKDLEPTG